MSQTTPEEAPKTAFDALVRDVDYVYVNTMQATVTLNDLHLAFGQQLPSDQIVPKVGLTMSLHCAKQLHTVLGAMLTRAEAEVKHLGLP